MKITHLPTHDDIDRALSRVTNSEMLQNSDRSKEFLQYVVRESLANRANSIRGKTIAADVFGRDPTEKDSDNVVRVEARRLRRKLGDYYQQEGKNDLLRIHIDSGGYVPRFEVVEVVEPSPGEPSGAKLEKWKVLVVACVLVVLIGLGYLALQYAIGPQLIAIPSQQQASERKALREKSLATLQAANLDLQGRNLLFPLFDPDRQKLAISLFQKSMEIDPTYFASYASAAHSFGTLALMTPSGLDREKLRLKSVEMAAKAVELAPQEAWAQAANAWAHHVSRDFDAAVRIVELALQLDPNDASVLDTYGLVMLVNGEFEKSVAATGPDILYQDNGLRLGRRNIFAVSSFHLGKYQNTLDSLALAVEHGDPVSGPTLVFTAVAYEGLGQTEKARAVLRELRSTYPGFRPYAVFSQFYTEPKDALQILSYLVRAGWNEDWIE